MSEILYKELTPHKLLSDFVKRFWTVSNPTADNKYYTILPDGYFDIILSITDDKLNKLSLTGIYTTEFEAIISPQTTFFGISFLPFSAEYILGQSLKSQINKHQTLDLNFLNIDKVNFNNFLHWTEELTTQFASTIKNGKAIDERKKKLFKLLFQTNGSLTVKDITSQTFWTSRQANRYFNTTFGLSLKAYSNILRCKQSFDDIKKGKLFPQKQYSDQAHLIREIKKHTGTTPKVLAKNEYDRFIQFSTRPK